MLKASPPSKNNDPFHPVIALQFKQNGIGFFRPFENCNDPILYEKPGNALQQIGAVQTYQTPEQHIQTIENYKKDFRQSILDNPKLFSWIIEDTKIDSAQFGSLILDYRRQAYEEYAKEEITLYAYKNIKHILRNYIENPKSFKENILQKPSIMKKREENFKTKFLNNLTIKVASPKSALQKIATEGIKRIINKMLLSERKDLLLAMSALCQGTTIELMKKNEQEQWEGIYVSNEDRIILTNLPPEPKSFSTQHPSFPMWKYRLEKWENEVEYILWHEIVHRFHFLFNKAYDLEGEASMFPLVTKDYKELKTLYDDTVKRCEYVINKETFSKDEREIIQNNFTSEWISAPICIRGENIKGENILDSMDNFRYGIKAWYGQMRLGIGYATTPEMFLMEASAMLMRWHPKISQKFFPELDKIQRERTERVYREKVFGHFLAPKQDPKTTDSWVNTIISWFWSTKDEKNTNVEPTQNLKGTLKYK